MVSLLNFPLNIEIDYSSYTLTAHMDCDFFSRVPAKVIFKKARFSHIFTLTLCLFVVMFWPLFLLLKENQ